MRASTLADGAPHGLSGARVVVVGASAGIGRACATAAARRGARVVLAARRIGALQEAAADLPGGIAIAADVTREEECLRLVDEARTALGGIDVVLYSVGASSLDRHADLAPADWSAVLETNLVGASNVVRAALPHLEEGAMVVLISSGMAINPYPGMVHYAASKAALEAFTEGVRKEHPAIRFGVAAVGATADTEFGNDFDVELLGALTEEWSTYGLLRNGVMELDALASALVDALGAVWPHPSVGMERIVLRPAFPPIQPEEVLQT